MNYQHKILIVDDEKSACQFIADLVSNYLPSAIITQINNPVTALTCLQNENFDMLFLDIQMPEMSGFELLERVKSFGKDPYTVIITAHRKFNYAVKGIELGVAEYITKPLYDEKIYEALQMYLQKIKSICLIIKQLRYVLDIRVSIKA